MKNKTKDYFTGTAKQLNPDFLNHIALDFVNVEDEEPGVAIWEIALVNWNKALAIVPNHPVCLYNRSALLWNTGRITKKAELLRIWKISGLEKCMNSPELLRMCEVSELEEVEQNISNFIKHLGKSKNKKLTDEPAAESEAYRLEYVKSRIPPEDMEKFAKLEAKFDSLKESIRENIETGDIKKALEQLQEAAQIKYFGTSKEYNDLRREIALRCERKSIASVNARLLFYGRTVDVSPDFNTALYDKEMVALYEGYEGLEEGDLGDDGVYYIVNPDELITDDENWEYESGEYMTQEDYELMVQEQEEGLRNYKGDLAEYELYDISTGKPFPSAKETYEIRTGAPFYNPNFFFSPDSKFIYFLPTFGATGYIYDIGKDCVSRESHLGGSEENCYTFSQDGKRLLNVCVDESEIDGTAVSATLYEIDTSNNHLIRVIKKFSTKAATDARTTNDKIALNRDGTKALMTFFDSRGNRDIELWDLSAEPTRIEVLTHPPAKEPKSVCFSPSGKHFISADEENVIIWDLSGEKPEGTSLIDEKKNSPAHDRVTFGGNPPSYSVREKKNAPIHSVAFAPCGDYVLVANTYAFIQLWDISAYLKSGSPDDMPSSPMHVFSRHNIVSDSNVGLNYFRISNDGTKLLSSTDVETIVYDIEYELEFGEWRKLGKEDVQELAELVRAAPLDKLTGIDTLYNFILEERSDVRLYEEQSVKDALKPIRERAHGKKSAIESLVSGLMDALILNMHKPCWCGSMSFVMHHVRGVTETLYPECTTIEVLLLAMLHCIRTSGQYAGYVRGSCAGGKFFPCDYNEREKAKSLLSSKGIVIDHAIEQLRKKVEQEIPDPEESAKDLEECLEKAVINSWKRLHVFYNHENGNIEYNGLSLNLLDMLEAILELHPDILDRAKSEERKMDLEGLKLQGKKLRNFLRKKIFGQDHVIDEVAKAIYSANLELKDDRKRPFSTLVLAGPPGVGKTCIAEALAEFLGIEHRRFDMSEYAHYLDHHGLIGFAPTWKDSEPGILTTFVEKNPKCILIFDEIEKAHRTTINLFLQILGDGKLTDLHTDRAVSFKDTYIVFTTNAGRSLYEGKYSKECAKAPMNTIINALETEMRYGEDGVAIPIFPKSIISRVKTGRVLLFNYLSTEALLKIISRATEKVISGLRKQNVDIKGRELVKEILLYREGGTADARGLMAATEDFYTDLLKEATEVMKTPAGDEVLGLTLKIDDEGLDEDIKRFLPTEESIKGDNLEDVKEKAMDLMREHKVLKFSTKVVPHKEKTKAVIELHDFKLERAPDIADADSILDDEGIPDVKFSDVIGADAAKKELMRLKEYMLNVSKFQDRNLATQKGVLLYGPPGTGKTMLARALAGETKSAFLHTDAAKLLRGKPNEVGDLFRKARKYSSLKKPAIIFIDEIDVIGKTRTGYSPLEEATLTALLTEMDGFDRNTEEPVFVIAATNFSVEEDDRGRRAIDEALLRRFDRHILVDNPKEEALIELYKRLVDKINDEHREKFTEDEYKAIASRSLGMSPAYVEKIVNLAQRMAMDETLEYGKEKRLSIEHIKKAYEEIKFGEEKDWGDDPGEKEAKSRTAHHEAGHTVIYYLNGVVTPYVTIEARGNHLGYMAFSSEEWAKSKRTKSDFLKKVRACLGGRAAEIVYYGEEDGLTTGAAADLRYASEVVRDMLTRYGMDEEYGLAIMNEADDSTYPELRKRMNESLRQLTKETKELITNNRHLVDTLATALLEQTSLEKSQTEALLKAAKQKGKSLTKAEIGKLLKAAKQKGESLTEAEIGKLLSQK